MVIRADGGSPRRLTTGVTQQWRPNYSSDGRWIYFGSDHSGTPQIWKARAEGGSAVQVTKNGGYEAMESLDGKTLYYVKSRFQNRPELWSRPVEGGEETLVIRPVWAGYWAVADGGIYFLDLSVQTAVMSGADGAPVPVMHYSLSTRRLTRAATAENAIAWGAPGFSVTRDGSAVLYVRANRNEADLVLIDNFR